MMKALLGSEIGVHSVNSLYVASGIPPKQTERCVEQAVKVHGSKLYINYSATSFECPAYISTANSTAIYPSRRKMMKFISPHAIRQPALG